MGWKKWCMNNCVLFINGRRHCNFWTHKQKTYQPTKSVANQSVQRSQWKSIEASKLKVVSNALSIRLHWKKMKKARPPHQRRILLPKMVQSASLNRCKKTGRHSWKLQLFKLSWLPRIVSANRRSSLVLCCWGIQKSMLQKICKGRKTLLQMLPSVRRRFLAIAQITKRTTKWTLTIEDLAKCNV